MTNIIVSEIAGYILVMADGRLDITDIRETPTDRQLKWAAHNGHQYKPVSESFINLLESL